MPKPTDQLTWATDANFPAGSDPWSGTPTKVQPPSGQQTAGWNPSQRPPAQYFNWLFNLVHQWIAYLDRLSDTRTKNLDPCAGYGTATTNIGNGMVEGTDLTWRVPVELDSGERIVAMRVKVKDNATGSQAFRVDLVRCQEGAVTDTIDSLTSDGSGTVQVLAFTTDHTIDPDYTYELHYQGDITSSGAVMTIYECSIDHNGSLV